MKWEANFYTRFAGEGTRGNAGAPEAQKNSSATIYVEMSSAPWERTMAFEIRICELMV